MPVNENIEKLNNINIFNFLKLTKLKMGFFFNYYYYYYKKSSISLKYKSQVKVAKEEN